jgi:hypothetical protein
MSQGFFWIFVNVLPPCDSNLRGRARRLADSAAMLSMRLLVDVGGEGLVALAARVRHVVKMFLVGLLCLSTLCHHDKFAVGQLLPFLYRALSKCMLQELFIGHAIL